MSLRLIGAALRNYVRPVLVRENPPAISAAIFTALMTARLLHERDFVRVHGLTSVFHHGLSAFVMFWWMIALFWPSCVSRHYWRQATTHISMAVPHFLEAEYSAILLVLLLVGIALATPLLALGAPIIGSIALATLPMIGGMSAPQATGQSRRKRVILTLLLLPLSLIFLFPGSMGWLLFAPLWITLPILLATAGAVVAKLRYLPARAQLQIDSLAARREAGAWQPSSEPRRRLLQVVWRCMRWQPRRWQDDALPRTLTVPLGPLGWVVFLSVTLAISVGLGILLRAFHEPLAHAVRQSALMAVTQLPMFAVLISGKWLMVRSDWPFLYLAGRHGPRHGFSRSLFRAHRRNALQLAGSTGLIAFLALRALMRTPDGTALTASASVAALVMGLTYVVAIPLLWRELGGRGMNLALNILAAFAATMTFAIGFGAHGLQCNRAAVAHG